MAPTRGPSRTNRASDPLHLPADRHARLETPIPNDGIAQERCRGPRQSRGRGEAEGIDGGSADGRPTRRWPPHPPTAALPMSSLTGWPGSASRPDASLHGAGARPVTHESGLGSPCTWPPTVMYGSKPASLTMGSLRSAAKGRASGPRRRPAAEARGRERRQEPRGRGARQRSAQERVRRPSHSPAAEPRGRGRRQRPAAEARGRAASRVSAPAAPRRKPSDAGLTRNARGAGIASLGVRSRRDPPA